MTNESNQTYSDTKLLWVSLTKQTTKEHDLSPDLFKHFLGGRGLGVKLVYDYVAKIQ